MSKEFTRNHIVPVAYLKRFAKKCNGKRIVGVRYDDGEIINLFEENIERVGFIKNYYDSPEREDIKYWEHFFADEFDVLCGNELETIVSVINLSNRDSIVLNDRFKDVLSRIIMCQLFRIPDSVNHIYSIFPDIAHKVKKELLSFLPEIIATKYKKIIEDTDLSEEQLKEIYLNYVFSDDVFKKYLSILKNNIWVVYYNVDSLAFPFVTSDNPVLVEGFGKKEIGLFNNGLAKPETCIFFSLTPSIAVAVYSKDGIVSIESDKLNGRKKLLHDIKFVTSKNVRIIAQSYKHSFLPLSIFYLVKEENKND